MNKHNVFLVCTGVGHINRGYESFTVECFNELKSSSKFELFLLKGGGASVQNEFKIACIKRNTTFAAFLNKVTGKEKYWIEQLTFLIGMLPYLIKHKPAVIYYSDFILGTFLYHIRKLFKFKYRLLFANGAPNGPPFKTEDHVQQLLPVYLKQAVLAGAPSTMQTLLPYGFDINIKDRLKKLETKSLLKRELGLTPDQKIIVSVGAVNSHHKRMDYIINEVAKLPSNYFLIILGQFESETPELLNLASSKLPGRHLITSVALDLVQNYYIISDYFVLASLIEGFGRVLIEAQSYGLTCVVNDYVNAREVLGDYGTYINMKEENALSSYLENTNSPIDKNILIEAAYNNYAWDKLKDGYINMITNLI